MQVCTAHGGDRAGSRTSVPSAAVRSASLASASVSCTRATSVARLWVNWNSLPNATPMSVVPQPSWMLRVIR